MIEHGKFRQTEMIDKCPENVTQKRFLQVTYLRKAMCYCSLFTWYFTAVEIVPLKG